MQIVDALHLVNMGKSSWKKYGKIKLEPIGRYIDVLYKVNYFLIHVIVYFSLVNCGYSI